MKACIERKYRKKAGISIMAIAISAKMAINK
jgi:hypothetical protein